MDKNKFPLIDRSISDFLFEEEANISRKKIISVGTLLVLATIMMTTDAFARHGSHGSHGSHSSHSSSTTHFNGHFSHESHESHASHASTTIGPGVDSVPRDTNSGVSPSDGINGGASSSGNTAPSNGISSGSTAGSVASTNDVPDGMIDIRVPLTPPNSPSMDNWGE